MKPFLSTIPAALFFACMPLHAGEATVEYALGEGLTVSAEEGPMVDRFVNRTVSGWLSRRLVVPRGKDAFDPRRCTRGNKDGKASEQHQKK